MVKYVLEKEGAEVNEKDNDGWTERQSYSDMKRKLLLEKDQVDMKSQASENKRKIARMKWFLF